MHVLEHLNKLKPLFSTVLNLSSSNSSYFIYTHIYTHAMLEVKPGFLPLWTMSLSQKKSVPRWGRLTHSWWFLLEKNNFIQCFIPPCLRANLFVTLPSGHTPKFYSNMGKESGEGGSNKHLTVEAHWQYRISFKTTQPATTVECCLQSTASVITTCSHPSLSHNSVLSCALRVSSRRASCLLALLPNTLGFLLVSS